MTKSAQQYFAIIRREEPEQIRSYFDGLDCSFVDDEYRDNALFVSIARKKNLTKFFIERGANVNQQDYQGNTPLHLAAEFTDLESSNALLENGARLDLQNKHGNQPLWTATFQASLARATPDAESIVRLFLQSGADPDHLNGANRSPRTIASRYPGSRLHDLYAGH